MKDLPDLERFIVGIDIGFDGGLTFMSMDSDYIETMPMPIFVVEKRKSRKIRKNEANPNENKTKTYTAKVKIIDLCGLTEIFRKRKPWIERVYIEQVGARREEGVSSVFRFGESFGMVQGVLASYDIPFEMVTPQTWTKVMFSGIPKTIDKKGRSKIAAQRKYPELNFVFGRCRSPHLGCVDATLIAGYGLSLIKGEIK